MITDFNHLNSCIQCNAYDNVREYPSSTDTTITKEQRKKILDIYKKESSRLYKEFKHDCKSAVDDDIGFILAVAPFEAAFQLAWENGHSSGFQEVSNYLYDLCPIIQKTAESIKSEINPLKPAGFAEMKPVSAKIPGEDFPPSEPNY